MMNTQKASTKPRRIGRHVVVASLAVASVAVGSQVAQAAPVEGGRVGKTIYVSKRGDNSDGSSWTKAFHTIQAGLQALPDDKGGHRVVVRPDAYDEANLWPSHKGAPGAYNVLVGDVDGKLGSGATGWVIVDSGAPEVVVRTDPKSKAGNKAFKIVGAGEAKTEWGLKSIDWWGPWRCDPTFSGVVWDRWIFRNIYATGCEGGIGWDMTCKNGTEFSAVVEDCVGIGRFAGAAVMGHVNRPDEPVIFRRSYFLCMDWWGDAGAAYVRAHNKSMPATPDAVFEDCTLVSPDNALECGYPGFADYTRVKFKGCRLIVLNFSQPHGTPSRGVIHTPLDGKQLHVDLEDCVLMGFRVFGAGKGHISYATKGSVKAYVQFRQPVPQGIERLRYWPADVFQAIQPPPAGKFPKRVLSQTSLPTGPKLVKLPFAFPDAMENTPFIYEGRPLLATNYRDDTKNKKDGYAKSMYFSIRDLTTGKEITRFAEGHSFVSVFVNGKELNVFGSQGTDRDWFKSIYRFSSTDMKTWKRELAIPLAGDEHLFNCSVCRDERGYTMAYESNKPVGFCFKFARSTDLAKWEKIEGLTFTGTGNEYSACPVLRYVAPYYYVIYLHQATPGYKGYISFMARSKDLTTWELSPANPILAATLGEGINNSDVDLFEWEGNTYLYYATGDQQTWGAVRVAMAAGSMKAFFESCFPAGAPTVKVSAKTK